METTLTDCSTALYFLPTLTHIACVKVALQIFTHIPTNIVNFAFEQIQSGCSPATLLEESCSCCSSCFTMASESLLFIPAHLRSAVVRAVNGMEYAVEHWRSCHSSILIARNEKRLYRWKSDGSIDLIKTAEAVVLRDEVDIDVKFHIACMYGLEGMIKKIYSEINAEQFGDIIAADKHMSNLGIHWLRDGCQASFAQTVRKHLQPLVSRVEPVPRFSSFFPVLSPEERISFLHSLMYTTIDDLKFCLCTVTKEENRRLMEKNALPFLLHHLRFPLQNLFLEATERMLNFMPAKDFRILALVILTLTQTGHKDYDYRELFEGYWKKIPAHLKQEAMKSQILREQIDSYRIQKLKRFAESQEEQNRKRNQIRSA